MDALFFYKFSYVNIILLSLSSLLKIILQVQVLIGCEGEEVRVNVQISKREFHTYTFRLD